MNARTFQEASVPAEVLTLLRGTLNVLGSDWSGIRAVHVQVLYAEPDSGELGVVNRMAAHDEWLSQPAALMRLFLDSLQPTEHQKVVPFSSASCGKARPRHRNV